MRPHRGVDARRYAERLCHAGLLGQHAAARQDAPHAAAHLQHRHGAAVLRHRSGGGRDWREMLLEVLPHPRGHHDAPRRPQPPHAGAAPAEQPPRRAPRHRRRRLRALRSGVCLRHFRDHGADRVLVQRVVQGPRHPGGSLRVRELGECQLPLPGGRGADGHERPVPDVLPLRLRGLAAGHERPHAQPGILRRAGPGFLGLPASQPPWRC
mmetsp:Transcript_45636/g.116785  ORF Transcript_45636/g.116785 Transcript_45636/m.116785 type:complete len:210 (-) Transcript_45636:240-869(-)